VWGIRAIGKQEIAAQAAHLGEQPEGGFFVLRAKRWRQGRGSEKWAGIARSAVKWAGSSFRLAALVGKY